MSHRHHLFAQLSTNLDDGSKHTMSPYVSNNSDMYFRDGKRRIDFVLVYDVHDNNQENWRKRLAFFNALTDERIEIEIEDWCGRILGATELTDVQQPIVEPIGFEHFDMATPSSPEYTVPVPSTSEGIVGTSATMNGQDVEVSPIEPSQYADQEGPKPSRSMDRYRLQAKQKDQRDYITAESAGLVFVKLYVPWETMTNYAERLYFRKQLCDPYPTTSDRLLLRVVSERTKEKRKSDCCRSCCEPDETVVKPIQRPYTWPFNNKRTYLFDIPEEKDQFFTPYERSRVADYILRRVRYIPNRLNEVEKMNIGITRLLNENVFRAAYPLHELNEDMLQYCETTTHLPSQEVVQPFVEPTMETKEVETMNNRILLSRYWASYKCFTKKQPLDYVRFYFGESIAFYFAWLGYYTTCLVPIAVMGVLVFLLGLTGLSRDTIVRDVCDEGDNFYMCPLCSKDYCQFWKLSGSCFRTKLTRLFDNEAAVVSGIIMALWAVVFLEMWKRQQTRLAHRWNVLSLEPIDKPPRPEFLALGEINGYMVKKNPVTGNEEPVVPLWTRRLPVFSVSICTVIFGVLMALAFLVAIIFYKLVVRVLLYQTQNAFAQQMAGIITTLTSSVINLIIIFLLKFIYNRAATKLTDMECHRTQENYDNSLTLKLYLLQFVNHNSTLFYIAFFQGTTSALPGSKHPIIQSTGCDQGNCLFELFLQLFIIMVGKQFLSFLQETLMPPLMRLIGKLRERRRQAKSEDVELADGAADVGRPPEPGKVHLLACKADYSLLDPGPRPLFDEYQEMLIQFGFITMFLPAFPLAPLFGLINNFLEIRVDAKKFVFQYRRPIMERVRTIGIWYSILVALSSIAIRTNACLIAFTTQFIDRWVYRHNYSPDGSLDNFLNFTLSFMNSSRFPSQHDLPLCRYSDYRTGPNGAEPYEFTSVYYHVLAAKFIFVFAFDIMVILLTSLLSILIPDIPEKIQESIYEEDSTINDIIYMAEVKEHKGHKRNIDNKRLKMFQNMILFKKQTIKQDESQQEASTKPPYVFKMHAGI